MGGGTKRPGYMGILLGILLILSGCATTQQTDGLRSDMLGLQRQMQDLDGRLQKLEQAVFGAKGSAGAGAGGLAALNARMDQIQMSMAQLKGQVEELRHAQQQSSAPPPSEPKPPSDQPIISIPGTPPPQGTAGTAPSQGPPPAQAAAPPQTAPAPNPEKDLYNAAMSLYQKGDHAGALRKFKEFTTRYPTSELADNAIFWTGECHFMLGSYQEAINSYQEVLDRFPKGNKASHALLKQGAAFEKLGDPTAARILYERVIQQYPQSPQAQVAKQWLERLK